MRYLLLTTIAVTLIAGSCVPIQAANTPSQGDWIFFKMLRADEQTPTAFQYVTLTVGSVERVGDANAQWWQLVGERQNGRNLVIQVLSDRVPMTTGDGGIGTVYRYIFRQHGRPALEYINQKDGLAYLPMFGFREGLVPTPRSTKNVIGGFLGTGSYLGQPISAQGHGGSGDWLDLGTPKKLVLNDDLTVGTARWHKDDGTGPGPDVEYTYVQFTAEDYEQLFDAGFNLFVVNNAHAKFVRERNVFFVRRDFGTEPYPELLYRSNYYGSTYYVDEPASRMDALDCRTVHDAINLLRTRGYVYLESPGYETDRVASLIREAGFGIGDWYPKQRHVVAWDTYHETAFYQLETASASFVHEGRYVLDEANNSLDFSLGAGAKIDTPQMIDATYAFMRGPARCFGKDWGTAIYGQGDYSIAPYAIKRAYDLGARHIWFWTSDHDHHVPFTRQIELAKIIRAHEKAHPRADRHTLNHKAKLAVAVPEGYIGPGVNMWWAGRFKGHHYNEFGVPYADVNSEIIWQVVRLSKLGVDYDCVVDVPEIIDQAGYDKIIRIAPDGTTDLPAVKMPATAPGLSIVTKGKVETFQPRADAPRAVAHRAHPGSIKIDADHADWKDASWMALETRTVYDDPENQWGGEEDLSARVAFAYDSDSLYVAAEVTDDVMSARFDGFDIWKNDCLQMGLDPLLNPSEPGVYSFDDSELGFSLIGGRPYSRIWEQQVSGALGDFPGAETAIIREGSITRYEVRIPFSSVRPLTPGYPGICGLNVVVNDSDGTGRKGAVGWTDGLVGGKNPSKWGVLEFADAGSLRDAAPVAYLRAEKTVVSQGETAIFTLETGSHAARDAEVVLTVRQGSNKAVPSTTNFKILPGMNGYQVRLDTRGLESGSYHADIAVKAGESTAVEQKIKFYILPGK